jgi:hypothetical protein
MLWPWRRSRCRRRGVRRVLPRELTSEQCEPRLTKATVAERSAGPRQLVRAAAAQGSALHQDRQRRRRGGDGRSQPGRAVSVSWLPWRLSRTHAGLVWRPSSRSDLGERGSEQRPTSGKIRTNALRESARGERPEPAGRSDRNELIVRRRRRGRLLSRGRDRAVAAALVVMRGGRGPGDGLAEGLFQFAHRPHGVRSAVPDGEPVAAR